ncbi:MAG: sigma-54 dependent transcriptional regulator [Deltaproteobacteria bacterium]|jgi:two-component system nitrogen regulation response regulator NtrX|nr:sigma-54 dependent transcriptional regulator [Deltaproteobacteria bacterium]
MPEAILIVDDEKDIRLTLGGILADEGYLISQASSGTEALERLEDAAPGMVLLDLWMCGYEQGFEVLAKIRDEYPQVPVVVISGHGNIETAIKAVNEGAYDFLEKPLSADKLLIAVQRALSFRKLKTENLILKNKSKPNFMVGSSPVMKALMRTIKMVAPTPASVLISGENGVGKELAARTIHELSQRADRPMIELNCAAIPEELVESELFGHEKGAFTGADRRRQGRFDMANHSTLFLDEIADMSLKTQSKILRIIQEQKFERVGGTKTIAVDARIICASNKNLEREIAAGRFRADLYYRLNVVPLAVPPLRERREDIPELAVKFLNDCLSANNLGPKTLDPSFLESLQNRPWPGNVRELKNTIERLAITTSSTIIDSDPTQESFFSIDLENDGESEIENGAASDRENDLSPQELTSSDFGLNREDQSEFITLPYRQAKAEFERRYFSWHLKAHGYNVTQTAEAVGLDRTNLHKKLKALGYKNWSGGCH